MINYQNKKSELQEFQKKINIQFKNEDFLYQSLLHRSFLNENKNLNLQSNERYEFLGDAVLELWCSDTIFRRFPDFTEGDMTNLRALVVRTLNLAKIAEAIDLGNYVELSKGEEKHGGRKNSSILADTFEALIGAIYLDSGPDTATNFMNLFILDSLIQLSQQKIFKDPKSIFQEMAQSIKGITPHYETTNEIGPDHQKTFEVAVYIGDEKIASGRGASKQEAEESASIKATKMFKDLV